MGDKKKLLVILISLLLLVIISGSVVLFCLNKKNGASDTASQLSDEQSEITRGEWIEVLARSLGMDEYQNEEAYFEDVTKDSSIYPFVQSSYEWKVLTFEAKAFSPEKPASREFVVRTAILASGIKYAPLQPDSDEKENILNYAREKGLIESTEPKYLKETVTLGEGLSAAEWAVDAYRNREFAEYENIEINDKVINYTELTQADITVTDDTVELSAEYAANMKAGDVFISPATVEDPYGVAHKVAAITYEEDRAIIQVVDPELGDIYDELEFATRAVPDMNHVILGEGVELASIESTNFTVNHDTRLLPTAYNAGNRNIFQYNGDNSQIIQYTGNRKGVSLSFNVNFTKGKMSVNPAFDTAIGNVAADISGIIPGPGSASPQEDLGQFFEKTGYIVDKVPDGHEFELNKDGFEKRLNATYKFEGGYEVTGTLAINNFYFDVECKTKKAFGVPYGIQYLITESNIDIESSLQVKGELSGELKISTLPIPIATGVTVDVDFILYADLNGELKVKAVFSNNTVTEYSDGNTKKTSKQTESVEGSIGATLEFGPSIKATLKALGIKLVDVQLKTGVLIEGEAKIVGETKEETTDDKFIVTRGIYLKADVGMYVPTITISIGTDNTLANKIGIKFTWKVCAKSGGLLKSTHIPFYTNSWPLWEKVEAVDIKEYEKNSGALGSLAINNYVLYMDMNTNISLEVTSLPPGYEREDLEAVSEDNSIVQVDGFGELTAISPGSTIITVSTKDGKYNVYCAVTVRRDME